MSSSSTTDVEAGKQEPSDILKGRSTSIVDEFTPLLKKGQRKFSIYERIFGWDLNRGVADDAELAFRGALAIVLLSIPLQRHFFDKYEAQMMQGQGASLAYIIKGVGQSLVAGLLFVLGRNLGQTLENARGAIVGTTMAVFTTWLFYGIFPKGYYANSDLAYPNLRFYLGLTYGVIFLILCNWLNLSASTRVFAVTNYVFFLMSFLNDDEDNFASGFTIRLAGDASIVLVQTSVGVAAAITVMLLPYPRLAIQSARTEAVELSIVFADCWDHAIKYFTAATADMHELDIALHNLNLLGSKTSSLEQLLAEAWWETALSYSTVHMTRIMLAELNLRIRRSVGALKSLAQMLQAEEFDDDHVKLADAFKENARKLLTDWRSVWLFLVRVACSGVKPSEEDLNDLRSKTENLEASMEAFLATFSKEKKRLGMLTITKGSLEEHVFIFQLYELGRRTRDAAEQFFHMFKKSEMKWVDAFREFRRPSFVSLHRLPVDQQDHATYNPIDATLSLVRTTFARAMDPQQLFEPHHLRFAFRQSLSLCAALLVGYYGYSKPNYYTVRRFNASIANAVGVMASTVRVPVMERSVRRVFGTAVGLIVGQLVYAVFSWCTVPAQILVSIYIFVVSLFGLFVNFNASANATVGFFFVWKGTSTSLQGCSNEVYNPAGNYKDIMDVVIAVFIMAVFDVMTERYSASEVALQSFRATWKSLMSATQDSLNPESKSTRLHQGGLSVSIVFCEDTNNQATDEFRMWKCKWRGKLFSHFVTCGEEMRSNLSVIEGAVADGHRAGAKKTAFYEKLMRNSCFDRVGKLLIKQMQMVEDLTDIFAHEGLDLPPLLSQDWRLKGRELKAEYNAALVELLKATGDLKFLAEEGNDAAETDNAAVLSTVMGSIDLMMEHLNQLCGKALTGCDA
jgi:hypothetical protein